MNRLMYIVVYRRANAVQRKTKVEVLFSLKRVQTFCCSPNRIIDSVFSYDFENRKRTELKFNVL